MPFKILRSSLIALLLVLGACESDTTEIVPYNDQSRILSLTDSKSGGSSASDYRLGPNDRLRVIVYGQPNLTGEYVLDANGVLAFPLIGNVNARGMSPSELQMAVASKLSPEFLRDPSVSVEVASRRPFYVVGEVQKPGSYAFVTDMTVLNAIATAGGETYRASMSSFYIKREVNGKIVRIVANQEARLQPGDSVMVRQRWF